MDCNWWKRIKVKNIESIKKMFVFSSILTASRRIYKAWPVANIVINSGKFLCKQSSMLLGHIVQFMTNCIESVSVNIFQWKMAINKNKTIPTFFWIRIGIMRLLVRCYAVLEKDWFNCRMIFFISISFPLSFRSRRIESHRVLSSVLVRIRRAYNIW